MTTTDAASSNANNEASSQSMSSPGMATASTGNNGSGSGSASGSSAGSGGNGHRTPARSNYAAPHTPIASAKRPRASMDKTAGLASPTASNSSNSASKDKVSLPPSTPLILEGGDEVGDDGAAEEEPATPQTPKQTLDRSQMSPMHPPRPLVIKEELNEDHEDEQGSWVGRQVGTLFSPMLNLLHKDAEDDHEHQHDHLVNVNVSVKHNKAPSLPCTEDDTDLNKPPLSDSTSLATSQETVSHDDAEDDNDNDNYNDNEQDQELDNDNDTDRPGDDDDVLVDDDGSSQGSLDEDEFNPYVFIKSLPSYELVAPLRPPIALPPKKADSPPISLVLDLDETLVHCTVEPVDDADLVFPVVFHGMTYQVHVRLRPHLFTFLEKIRGKYEVIVFTASQKVYADELLNLIDPEGKFIQHRMFRESCLAVEGNFLKDLNVLGRDLSKCVLVDNSPHAFGYQVDNGIPIESWFDDPNDTELLKLERFLRTLHGVKDTRSVIRKTFKTYQLIQEA